MKTVQLGIRIKIENIDPPDAAAELVEATIQECLTNNRYSPQQMHEDVRTALENQGIAGADVRIALRLPFGFDVCVTAGAVA